MLFEGRKLGTTEVHNSEVRCGGDTRLRFRGWMELGADAAAADAACIFTPLLLYVIVILCYGWEVGCRVGVSVTDCIHFSQLLH